MRISILSKYFKQEFQAWTWDLMWKKKAASDSHDEQLLASVVPSPGVDSSVLFGWEVSTTQPDYFPEEIACQIWPDTSSFAVYTSQFINSQIYAWLKRRKKLTWISKVALKPIEECPWSSLLDTSRKLSLKMVNIKESDNITTPFAELGKNLISRGPTWLRHVDMRECLWTVQCTTKKQ